MSDKPDGPESERAGGAPAVTRAIRILDLLADGRAKLAANEIADRIKKAWASR